MSASCSWSWDKIGRTVVHGLKVIYQCQDILMSHRHLLQNCNLIPDHMFSPRHESFVDNFRGIISARVDMHAFFDH